MGLPGLDVVRLVMTLGSCLGVFLAYGNSLFFQRGEAIQAFVVTTDGANVTEEEIIDYCKENFAKFKVPSEVHIVNSLPKTPASKIDKMALRDSFEHN